MIHVILTILKILGIVILVLLGIILLILLIVLTVPVRCRISGYYRDKSNDIYVKIDLSWLLHLVLYRFVYHGGIQENDLKVSGITVYPRKNDDNRKKKKVRKKKSQKENTDGGKCSEDADINEKPENDSLTNNDIENTEIKKDTGSAAFSSEDADNIKTDDESFFEKLKKKTAAVLNKIKLFFIKIRDKIKNKYQNIKDKAEGFIKKATDIRSFIQDSENIEAFKNVLIGVKNLLVHMRPRKMRINGTIGFDDPALTGQLFAVLGILYPYYGKNANVTASFDEKIIDVEFDIKGRLMLMYAVFIVARLLGNERIRKWVFRK